MQSFQDQNTNCLLREKREGKGNERKQRIWAFMMYNMTLPSIIILPSLTHMTTICTDKNETIGEQRKAVVILNLCCTLGSLGGLEYVLIPGSHFQRL